jgi:hypothetical protein
MAKFKRKPLSSMPDSKGERGDGTGKLAYFFQIAAKLCVLFAS